MLRPRKVPPRRNHNFRMSRRAVLRSGGLAAAGALPLPLAGWRAPRARAAPPPPGVTVRVEQLAGGLGPEDCPASLAFRLRGEDGADLAWEDLVPYAMPGVKPQKLHVRFFDPADPDIPGVEIGHVHPAKEGATGEIRTEFVFPHAGRYEMVAGFLTDAMGGEPTVEAVRIDVERKAELGLAE